MFSAIVATIFSWVSVVVALDALPTYRYPEHGHRLEAIQNLRRQEPNRPLVVVVGSSRTQLAIDPSAMGFAEEPSGPFVFNYGLTGALPVHLPLGLRRLRAAGVSPDAVVVEVFPSILNVDDAAATVYAGRGVGLTTLELVALAPSTREVELFTNWGRSRVPGCDEFKPDLGFASTPEQNEKRWYRLLSAPDRYGFPVRGEGFTVPQETRRRSFTRVRDLYAWGCAHLNPCPMAVQAYRDLVADCRAHGTPVALYLTPESPAYHTWYSPESRARLAEFAREFSDLGCPVFDASAGWDEDDFVDGHHMFPAGAARFSRHFAETHLQPWLAAVLPRR